MRHFIQNIKESLVKLNVNARNFWTAKIFGGGGYGGRGGGRGKCEEMGGGLLWVRFGIPLM